jgi:uncharacterized membrane protein YdbT with pleckstrin-like domain
MNGYRRPHPLFILRNLWRFAPLLIAPLLRGLILAARKGSLDGYIDGMGFDIWVAATMVALSLADWQSMRYRATEQGVDYVRGVLRRRRGFIPAPAAYRMDQPLGYRLVGAARLWIDTSAGSYRRSDFSVVATRREAQALVGRTTLPGHRPTASKVAVMAFITSNASAGVLVLFATVRGMGRILGRGFERQVWGGLQQLAALLAFGLPPAAAAVGYLLIGGWALALMLGFLKFWGFRAARQDEQLTIATGLLSREHMRISAGSVSYVDIRRNLACVLLHLNTVLVLAPGLGGKPAVVVPAAGKDEAENWIARLLPGLRPDPLVLRPARRAFIRYYSEPIWQLAGMVALVMVVTRLLPHWRDAAVYLGAMGALIPIWRLGLAVADLKTAGAGRGPERFTLAYGRGLYLHRVVVSMHSLTGIKIRRSPLQRLGRSCDILLTTCVEGRYVTHRLRSYPHAEATAFFGLAGP